MTFVANIPLLSWKKFLLIITLLLSSSVSVAIDDEDSAASENVIESDSSTVSLNSSSTTINVSSAQGSFVQRLMVGDGKTFDDIQIDLFQTYYERLTVNYAPKDVDISDGEIVTTCTINDVEIVINTTSVVNTALEEETPSTRHLLRARTTTTSTVDHNLDEREVLEEEDLPVEALDIEFTMSYESQYDDVTNYDALFQTWINANLVTVAEQLQVLSLNVTEVKEAWRLVQPDSTWTPTEFVSQTQSPSGDGSDTDAPTESPTVRATPTSKNENGLAIILSSFFLGTCIVVAGLLVYWKKHRTVGNSKRRRKRRSTDDEINGDNVEAVQAANIKIVRIQEPTPSTSSTSSKDDSAGVAGGGGDKERDGHPHNKEDDDDGEETPTCGEHYDDWVHHYFKTKNEKKERKKKRASSSASEGQATKEATTTKTNTSPLLLYDPERMNDQFRSDSSMVSASSMNTSLQRLEEQRNVLSEQEYEDRRREILLAALQ